MVAAVLALLGLWLLWSRWSPLFFGTPVVKTSEQREAPLVSIIVPARNEEKLLPLLLDSLVGLEYSQLEIIVVDDRSDDATAEIAGVYSSRGVRVVTGTAKPEGWGGKQWACHQGAAAATGALLLFTDADTVHSSLSLSKSVAALLENGGGMLTAMPYHTGESWWERLCGPFHVMLLTVTAPLGTPRRGRVYAIGQYLLFERKAYDAMGGHESVKAELVEDLPLANGCLRAGLPYKVYAALPPLYEVRMYASLAYFVAGWRRNIRAGLGMTTLIAPLEITLIIAAMTGGGKFVGSYIHAGLAALAMIVVSVIQRRLGRFSNLGPVLFPFALGLFCFISLCAALDMLRRQPMVWKGRAYPV